MKKCRVIGLWAIHIQQSDLELIYVTRNQHKSPIRIYNLGLKDAMVLRNRIATPPSVGAHCGTPVSFDLYSEKKILNWKTKKVQLSPTNIHIQTYPYHPNHSKIRKHPNQWGKIGNNCTFQKNNYCDNETHCNQQSLHSDRKSIECAFYTPYTWKE